MEAIFVIIAAVALVWLPIIVPRVSLLYGCLLYILLTSCFGYHFFHFDVGPIQMSVDRLYVMALIALFGVQAILGRTSPKPLRPVDWLLGLFISLLLASAMLHNGQAPTNYGGILQHLATGYLMPLAIYWIARQSQIGERQTKSMLIAMVCFGVCLSVIGILEIAGIWSLVFPKYIADPDVGIHFGRARGPMVHSVSYGATLAICILCGWILWPGVKRTAQFVLICLLPVALVALFFSYTRSVWLGFALGLLTVMFFSLRGSWRTLLFGGLTAAGLLVAVTQFDNIISFGRSTETASDSRESVHMRKSFAYVSWKMFQERPLFGFGFGQFGEAKKPFLHDRSVEANLQSIREYSHHNTFLSILTELGIIGFALFISILVGWGVSGYRLMRNQGAPPYARSQGTLMLGVLGIYCSQALFHEMSYISVDHALLFLLAGVTIGLSPVTERAAAISFTDRLMRLFSRLRRGSQAVP